MNTTSDRFTFWKGPIYESCLRPIWKIVIPAVLASAVLLRTYAIFTPPARRAWRSYKFASLDFSVFFFFRVESWAAAHGLYRCAVYRLLSKPMSTRLLNSISSRICRQNTQFNMYTTTSKQQEGCTFEDSHPKCFITTNFDKFHREAFARGVESRWCFDSMFPWYTKSKVNSNRVCNYYDFIRREGLSLLCGSISLSTHSEKIYTWQSRFLQMFISWCFWY